MADKEAAIKETYSKNLKALNYAATYQRDYYKEDPVLISFPMKFYKDVLQSGRFKGSTLLEIGSGALVHNIASASAFYPNIIMSDYVQDNCEELKRWLKGESPLKQFLDIPAEFEGYGKDLETGKQLLEQRIRKNVKQVVRCDVLNDNILLEEPIPEVAPPYDLVLSSLCLEAAVPDLPGLILVFKRINKLLRPGGGLILVGFTEGGTWSVDETVYPYVSVTENDLIEALSESGFGNIDFKTHDKLNVTYDHDKYYCLSAEKLKNLA